MKKLKLQNSLRLSSATKTLLVVTAAFFIALFASVPQANAATFTVSNLGDRGAGSLRQAISDANASAGNDVIAFSVTGTVTLTSGELAITDSGELNINGPGAGQLTVSGNGTSRVFSIGELANATISGLTISNGNGDGAALQGNGGGVFVYGGTLRLNNSTVSNNSATFGGGIFNYVGTVTLHNSTVSNNLATSGSGSGGGICNILGTLTLNNSTVSNNSATNGGGIFDQFGTVTLDNSIIANSTSGGDCLNTASVISLYSLIDDASCGIVNGVDGNLTGDPNLGPLQDNGGPTFTHRLLPGSLAIDTGSNALVPAGTTTDQRGTGFARIFNVTVDMGAVEVQATLPADADSDGVPDDFDVCSGTVLPETAPEFLKKNRFYANGDGEFVDANGTLAGMTVIDTGGCSGSQIIAAVGLGLGHTKFGISRSALEAWIAALP